MSNKKNSKKAKRNKKITINKNNKINKKDTKVKKVAKVTKSKKGTNKKVKGKNIKNKKTKLKKIVIISVLVIFLLILTALGVFAGIFFSDKFAITRDDLILQFSNTLVYDSEGNIIAELSGDENRKIISMSEMSEYLPKAFVAIEDERFYKHSGVDIKRDRKSVV